MQVPQKPNDIRARARHGFGHGVAFERGPGEVPSLDRSVPAVGVRLLILLIDRVLQAL